ncbi:glycosyltransferase family protein [Desulfonatronum parangueonense]
MKTRQLIPVTLLLSIFAWIVLSWPLPMHMNKAITLSAHQSTESIVYMIPGDSLQLLHYFELVHEWITGGTPWFYNLYEFNTGDDSERYSPGGYYVPFSVIYSAVRSFTTQALGMNVAGIFSLWATVFATWLLLRRYTKDEWVVALFSLFVIFFPYRWSTLFDSSPTGYAMMWVPVLILGLDIAIRDGKALGGMLAGIAVIFTYLCDSHVFFFSVLIIPAWCLLAMTAESRIPALGMERIKRIIRALIPVAATGGVVVLAVRAQARFLSETSMAQGRSVSEVMLFSPQAKGFFAWQGSNISSQVYVGWSITIIICLGLLAMTWSFLRRPREQFQSIVFISLLCLGILTVAVLALGPHGLRSGGLFLLARELVPPYAMIRQAGKIFSIMPTLLAVAGVLALTALIKVGVAKAWWRGFCVAVAAVALFWEYTALSTPDLLYLQDEQSAYRAVAEDARSRDVNPHILVIPLWPGDSHYSATYQHFALMYRIRMINGYTPAVSMTYFEEVFLPFQSINQGYLSTEQVGLLRSMGVGHIVVHEDLYPEKVAPFPVSYAIKQYLQHPHLEFLARGDSVWAFKIHESPQVQDGYVSKTAPEHKPPLFPARHWEMEWSAHEKATLIEDASASNKNYIILDREGSSVHLAHTGAPPAPGLRWMIRCRGQGHLKAETRSGPHLIKAEPVAVDHQDWFWLELPVHIETHSDLSLRLLHVSGIVELDSALMSAGDWPLLQPGETLTLPAASFFRAGYTDLDQHQVVFLKKFYAERVVFYGPRMPLEPGLYEVSLAYSSDAAPGVEIGSLHVTSDTGTMAKEGKPLYQGQDWRFEMRVDNNLPFNMDLFFTGQADLLLDSITFRRLE